MNDAVTTSSHEVSPELNSDLLSIMNGSRNVSPFIKLFWDEQQKYIATASNLHLLMTYMTCLWHTLWWKNGTGFLILPSRRRLRDYKNYIKPQQGFNKMIIEELKSKIRAFTDIEKYFIVSFWWDETTGKSRLV